MDIEVVPERSEVSRGAQRSEVSRGAQRSEVSRGAQRSEASRDLARAAAGLSKQVEVALNAVELSLSQYRVLSFLEDGSSESAALARRLAVRPPSVTSVVDGLVQRRLVERHHSADDRRRVHHVLTADGRGVLEAADRVVADRLESIAACLGGGIESARACDGLVTWRHALVAYRQHTVRS